MKIAVALSGGVDSAFSAYLLKKAGHEVFGLFMKNWEEKDKEDHCFAKKDFEDVVKICQSLDIPYYAINFVKEYWKKVFSTFIEDLKLGLTPNPDILCNQKIKFDVFYRKALMLGADRLATGHYCQTDGYRLFKGKDPSKDQSYFLCNIEASVLKNVLFPIGSYLKTKVRALSQEIGLPVFDKKDSTGICFIGKRPFKSFIEKYIPNQVGHFETLEGKIVGKHMGAIYYTIGQRRGMALGGPGKAWYVAAKNIKRNAVIVVQGENHPALFASTLFASKMHWIGDFPFSFPFHCSAKIRYRQKDSPCVIESLKDDKIHVTFLTPQRAITPGQTIVFYQEEVCIGGARIDKVVSNFF